MSRNCLGRVRLSNPNWESLLLVLQDQAKLNEWQGEDYTQASFLRFDQTLVMSMRPALAMLLASTEDTSR